MKDFKRILSLETLSFIKDKAKQSTTYGKYMATYVSAFTMLMKTCKGRDKICSVIQYIADFYYNCNRYSQIEEVIDEFNRGNNTGAIICHKLKISMKNSRKIFKFLKFMDQLSSIVKNIESKKPIFLKIVVIMQHLMAFFSNIFDNIIWGINIQVLDIHFRQKQKTYKANKYFFSLCKIIFKMLGNNFKHHNRIKSMKQILTKLKTYKDDQLQMNPIAYQLCKDYLKQRKQVRIQSIDGVIMLFRIIMLIRKLRLPGYTFVTKILYSGCGLISTLLSAYKMIIDQPVLVQIQEKQVLPIEDQPEGKFQQKNKVQKIRIARTGSFRIE